MEYSRTEKNSKRQKGGSKAVSVIIYIIGGALILSGAYMIGRPFFGTIQNKQMAVELIQSMEKGETSYEIKLTDLPPLPEESLGLDQDWPDYNENYDPATDTLKINVIGRVIMEKIDCDLPLLDNWGKQELRIGLGHDPSSALPGQTGNCIIAGHRSYTYNKQFNRMREAEIGDTFELWDAEGNRYKYEIYEIEAVLPDDPKLVQSFEEEKIATLFTCDPIYVATHRLYVRGRLVDQLLVGAEE